MIFYTSLFFLVIAISLDGFGVGIVYGIRKIHVPFFSLFIIMICSGITVGLSMALGELLSSFISQNQTGTIGGIILISLGVLSLINLLKSKTNLKQSSFNSDNHTSQNNIPLSARIDLDQSGTISAREALILGIALSMDAFGAGIGISMIGYSPFPLAIFIALMSGLFLYSGLKMGLFLSQNMMLV